MKDYIDLGPCPIAEDCIPAGQPGGREECRRYLELCRTIFPQANEFGVRFTIKSNPHDFGNYYEVNVVVPDDNDEQAMAYAYWIQDNQPEQWTDTEPRIYTPESDDNPIPDYPDFTGLVRYMESIGR